MKWLTALVVVLSLAFGLARLTPGFPARPASAWGTYEAFAHIWASATFFCPLIFWHFKRKCEADSYAVAWIFRPYNTTAWVAFISSLVLTFGVEAVMFFIQVPYPWHK